MVEATRLVRPALPLSEVTLRPAPSETVKCGESETGSTWTLQARPTRLHCRPEGPPMILTTRGLFGALAVLLAGATAVGAAQDQAQSTKPTTVTLAIEGMT